MSFDVPMRQTTFDGVLRLALLGSGLADLAFGVVVFVNWQWLLGLLHVPPPPNEVFLYLAANVTIGLALTYVIAALAPWRYHANITIAALARFGGAIVIAVLILRGQLPRELRLTLMAAAELTLGILHLIYSRRLAPAAAGPQ